MHYWQRFGHEDTLENLRTAKKLSMKTVRVSAAEKRPAYVDVCVKSVLQLPRRLRQL